MPRDTRLPKYVYCANGRYFHKAYLGTDGKGKPRFGPEIRLCADTAPISEVWAAYEALTDKGDSLNTLCGIYHKSPWFKALNPRTQKDYIRYRNTITLTKTKDGTVFGEIPYKLINPQIIKRYRSKRAETAIVQANREKSYLQTVFAYAFEEGLVSSNPCQGIRKIRENPKRQYVDEDRYAKAFELALTREAWYLPVIMVLGVACRARKSEMLDLRKSDIIPDTGLYMRRRKGSKDNIVKWSEALKWAVETALARPSTIESVYLLHDKHGQPIKEHALNNAWQRFMKQAVKQGIQRFTIHDLKRKGISDDPGNWMEGSGHRSPSMGKVYDIKPKKVDSSR